MEKKTAIITGASSGESYSRKFASQGYNLLLIARRKEKLLEISENIKELYNSSVEILSYDLSDEDQIKNIEKEIIQRNNIYVLVNNAGFGLNEKFHITPIEKSIAMINVHILATVRLTKAVLPIMIKNNSGIIINVSSMASFIMAPNNLIYSATKSFLNTFSEHLKLELKNTNILVQSLCPGYTKTGFYDTDEYKNINLSDVPEKLWFSVDELVEKSEKSLSNKNVIYIPGFINKLAVKFRKIISRRMIKKINKLAKTENGN